MSNREEIRRNKHLKTGSAGRAGCLGRNFFKIKTNDASVTRKEQKSSRKMSITNFSENTSFQEQLASYLANESPSISSDEQTHIDAVINIINRHEQAKKATPNKDIRINNSEFKVINQLIMNACSALEKTVTQQANRVGNHCGSVIQHLQQGLFKLLNDQHEEQRQRIDRVISSVTEQESFQFKLLEQYEELKEEVKQLRLSKSAIPLHQQPTDLTRENVIPGPDQDSNGCLSRKEIDELRKEKKKKLVEEQPKT